MKVVYYSSYGGFDWHDACSHTDFLKEKHGNPYNITNPIRTIAERVYDMFAQFVETCLGNNTSSDYKITFEMSVEDIVEKMEKREKISIYDCIPNPEYEDDYENWMIFDSDKLSMETYYCGGQVSYDGYFTIADIPDEKVRYIVCENFLAPNKGVPSVQRFYHEPFTDYYEMLSYYCNMPMHGKEDNYCGIHSKSVKEIIIINVDSTIDDDWFNSNMQAIELSKDHPDAEFKMYVKQDIEYLKGLK